MPGKWIFFFKIDFNRELFQWWNRIVSVYFLNIVFYFSLYVFGWILPATLSPTASIESSTSAPSTSTGQPTGSNGESSSTPTSTGTLEPTTSEPTLVSPYPTDKAPTFYPTEYSSPYPTDPAPTNYPTEPLPTVYPSGTFSSSTYEKLYLIYYVSWFSLLYSTCFIKSAK